MTLISVSTSVRFEPVENLRVKFSTSSNRTEV